MREILFRGKTKHREWIYGDLITHGIDFDDAIKQHHTREVWDIIPETIGQFTGLTDKNGKKIFEGDILAETWWGELYAKNPILCKFHNGSFCFTKYYIWDTANNCERAWVWKKRFLKKELKYCEIIGNIHDNPKLLGE